MWAERAHSEGDLRVSGSNRPSKGFQAAGHGVDESVGHPGINEGYPALLTFGEVSCKSRSPWESQQAEGKPEIL